MSEWIKRSDQEPPVKSAAWKHDTKTGDTWLCCSHRPGSASFDLWIGVDQPLPPPRMVTIEISEEDARHYASASSKMAISDCPGKRVADACRDALAKREGQ